MTASVVGAVGLPSWVADTAVLAPAERRRAAAMGSPAARRRQERALVLLRLLVADRLGGAPREVPLRTPGGTPPQVVGQPGIGVSVAHAGDVVVAVVGPPRVGVDVEVVAARSRPVPASVADEARVAVAARHPLGRAEPALLAWVVQEAALKAAGSGLGVALERVELRLADAGLAVTTPDGSVFGVAVARVGDGLLAVAVPDTVPAVEWRTSGNAVTAG